MILLFRISVQLSVEAIIAMRSTATSTLKQLPAYFYLITGRIELDCFERPIYSQCIMCNKTVNCHTTIIVLAIITYQNIAH